MAPIARMYREAQRSFVDFFGSLEPSEWATPVPCTPLWTVRDVLSHVAGVTDDIANGRIQGASTPPWTAAQVERWRDAEVASLIEQWNSQIDGVADLIETFGELRPVFDCYNHEHDIRHAVGRPGQPQSSLDDMVARHFASVGVGRPLTVTFADGAELTLDGEGDPLSLDGITQYEFVRSRLGRRSRDQVAALGWSEPVDDAVLDGWFIFGPAEHPILEHAD